MAKIVGGFGSGHTPLMSIPGQMWSVYAQGDPRNRELVKMPEGKRVTYDELLKVADPASRTDQRRDVRPQVRQHPEEPGCDGHVLREANPDVVVMFGDDQGEMFFDDNYAQSSTSTGATHQDDPSRIPPGMHRGDADLRRVPTARRARLSLRPAPRPAHHRVCSWTATFDVAQSRYVKEELRRRASGRPPGTSTPSET